MKINSTAFKALKNNNKDLYTFLKIEFIYHSGNKFSYDELTKIVNDIPVEGNYDQYEILEIKNYSKVFDQVITDSDIPLSKNMLLNWHKILKTGARDEKDFGSGTWKKYVNRIHGSELVLPLPEEVDGLMTKLIDNWNTLSTASIYDITKFHTDFESIHPFQDGNGRIGRMIILKQCIEKNIDLIAIDDEYFVDYRRVLKEIQTKKVPDINRLLELFKYYQDKFDTRITAKYN